MTLLRARLNQLSVNLTMPSTPDILLSEVGKELVHA